ncbi:MAG TPA: DCL family protein [Candidatus Acidoferrales bacterium]|nr:DCL family protein [Candidatus Acidoferrales bacterium]
MARRKAVELGTRTFNTQEEASAFFKGMLNRYKPGDQVSAEDFLDLAALLERHPEYAAKVGCGVSHFQVIKTVHGTQCFRIVRLNGTGTDFSYPRCISQRAPSRKQEVSRAFRRAVAVDLYKARDAFFAEHIDADGLVACAATGERISRDQAHLDHRPPMTFEVIVTTFLCSRGLSLGDVPLTTGQDDQVCPEVTDDNLVESFRAYHGKVAQLDFVKNTVNLAESSRHRLKAGRVNLSKAEGGAAEEGGER